MKPNLMPILNSHYTEDNLINGIDPVYLQAKAGKKTSEQPRLLIKVIILKTNLSLKILIIF